MAEQPGSAVTEGAVGLVIADAQMAVPRSTVLMAAKPLLCFPLSRLLDAEHSHDGGAVVSSITPVANHAANKIPPIMTDLERLAG